MYKKNILLKSLIFTVFFISNGVHSDEPTEVFENSEQEGSVEGASESSETDLPTEGASESSETDMPTEGASESSETDMPTEGASESSETEIPTEGASESSTSETSENSQSPPSSSEKTEEKPSTDASETSSPKESSSSETTNNSENPEKNPDSSTNNDKPVITKPTDTQEDTLSTGKNNANSESTNDKANDSAASQPTEVEKDTSEKPVSSNETTSEANNASSAEIEESDADTTTDETETEFATDNINLTQPDESSTSGNADDWFILPTPEQDNDADHHMQTRPGTAIVIDLNVEGHNTQKLILKPSTNSVVINNGDGTVTYTPDGEFFGIDVFTYTYIDENGKKQEGKVNVTVQEDVGEPPQPATCQIYATHNEEGGHTQLITIDPVGYSAVALGPLYQQYDITGIAIDPVTRMLYAMSGEDAVSSQAGMLYLVNAHTGELVTIGNTNFGELTALAFHPDGTLWAWSEDEGIIQIDKDTGIGTVVSPIPSVEVEVPVKTNTDKKDKTPTTNKNPSPPKEEDKVVGTVLFVDASSEEENASTRKKRDSKEATVTTKTINIKNVQGLAWNSDGSLLYATYGYSRTLWVFNPQTSEFKQACDDLPNKVTALETLADGMLMFAVPQKSAGKVYGSKMYVYDPINCKVILNRSFVTTYSNLESVAWPADCQALPELQSWKISFDGDDNTAMCLKEPQWITLKGVAKLDPANSQAYLETGWRVVSPEKVACPTTNKTGELIDCTKEQVSSKQIIIGKTEFKVTGWWPGIPDGAGKNATAETLYAANLFDMNGKRLPGQSRIEKTLVGSASLCPEFLDEPQTCVDENGKPLENCGEDTCVDENGKPLENCGEDACVDENGKPLENCGEDACVDENGKPLGNCGEDACVDEDGKPLENCGEDACVDEDGKPLENCGVEDTKGTVKEECTDDNEDCSKDVKDTVEQEEMTDDSEETTPLTTPYDKATLEKHLADEDYTFAEDDSSISVWYEGQLLEFAFADLLDEVAEQRPPEGELLLEPTEDVNDDGYKDYKIIYPDGTTQQVHYLGIIDEIEKPSTETCVEEDATCQEENTPEETAVCAEEDETCTTDEVLPTDVEENTSEEGVETESEDEQDSQLSGDGEEAELDSSKDEKADSSKDEKADSSKDEKVDSSKDEKVDSSKDEKVDSSKDEKVDSSKDEKVDSSKDEKVDSSKDEKVDSSKDEKADSSKDEKVDSSKDEKVDSSKDEKADSSKGSENTSQKVDTVKQEPVKPKEDSVKAPTPEKQEPAPSKVEEKAPTSNDSAISPPAPVVSD